MPFILDHHDQQTNSNSTSNLAPNIERQLRIDLAAAYRLCAINGWGDLIYTHISVAPPDTPNQFLINPFGLSFSEIRASDLIKINHTGDKLSNSPYPVNKVGFTLHSAIHQARPDALCVMHLHNNAAIAVSAQKEGLRPLSQHALRFYERISYHDYQGVQLTPHETSVLLTALGSHQVLLLRNHGSLVIGRTVAEAYVLMATLIKACEIQLLAGSGLLQEIPSEIAADTAKQLCPRNPKGEIELEGELEWPALLRGLDRLDSSYKI